MGEDRSAEPFPAGAFSRHRPAEYTDARPGICGVSLEDSAHPTQRLVGRNCRPRAGGVVAGLPGE